MNELNHALWLVNLLLLVGLASKLVWSGIHLRYKAFFLWVCFQVARNGLLDLLNRQESLSITLWFRPEPFEPVEIYFYFWLWSEPILVLTFILAVFEIYSLALQRYRGIRMLSTRALTLAMVLATLISALSIMPDLQFNAAADNAWFLLTNVIRRGIYTCLFAFIVLLVSFITFFPVRLSRNSILHVGLFSTVFLANAASILSMNFGGPDVIPVVNAATAAVSTIAFLAWILFLTPAGETVERSVRSNISSAEAESILAKLRQVSDSLASSKKWL
ncbi:MAG: hypothetical protein U5J83_18415 [Bryobacterales bacterium]|nr:hypothetical protein [Bryobacterales bacterium]